MSPRRTALVLAAALAAACGSSQSAPPSPGSDSGAGVGAASSSGELSSGSGTNSGSVASSGSGANSGSGPSSGPQSSSGSGSGADAGAGSSSGTSSGPSSSSGAGSTSGGPSGSGSSSGSASSSGSSSGSVRESGSGSSSGAKSGSGSEAGSTTCAPGSTARTSTTNAFSQCRFHFGTQDSVGTQGGAALISQLDLFTSGWIGTSNTFNEGDVCTETNPGGAFEGKVPALVAYIISFTARGKPGWCLSDCNANNATCTPASDLCTKGADYLRQFFTSDVLPLYKTFAQGFASACGTTRPIIWEMEPDFYQYYDAAQGGGTRGQAGGPLSVAEAVNYMTQMVATVKQYLPNALFSMDISPWMPDNGCAWYPNFDLTDFAFISTSGGNTDGASTFIRTANTMTWAGVHAVTGKPILADTGYGTPPGPDANWDNPTNINARIADGVISIMQYSPNASTWANTITQNRPSLNPVSCY